VFERFEPAARQAFVDAWQEAGQAGQDQIRSEHVLLGLLREPGHAADALTAAGLSVESLRARVPGVGRGAPAGLDADALAMLGIDLDAVRRATDAAFGPGALDRAAVRGQTRLPVAGDTKQAIGRAVYRAQKLGQRKITSGHMLIGILDSAGNGALTALAREGTDIKALRADVLRRIAAQPPGSDGAD
jgi:ATP-dependent Clp protease ATP-binding subunit ClpA